MILPVVGGTVVEGRGIEVSTAGVVEGLAGVYDGCTRVVKGLSVLDGRMDLLSGGGCARSIWDTGS